MNFFIFYVDVPELIFCWYFECIKTAEPYVEPPNDVDIQMAVSKIKNGKATGHDQIAAELIKGGGKELEKAIYELISKIWAEEIIPHGIICPIRRKEDMMMCDNYRAVTSMCKTYKIVTDILYVN
jgi:hypothetical protein